MHGINQSFGALVEGAFPRGKTPFSPTFSKPLYVPGLKQPHSPPTRTLSAGEAEKQGHRFPGQALRGSA